MSKSLTRVRAALVAAGVAPDIRETALARTALDAATALGCSVDQIAKSIVLYAPDRDELVLFLTAGGSRVDLDKAGVLMGGPLTKADASQVRQRTGFAIGGVAPLGHLTPPRGFFDPKLLTFDRIWAAAGTPHHVFGIEPHRLIQISEAQHADFTSISEKM